MSLFHAPASQNHPLLASMAPLVHGLPTAPTSAAPLLAPSYPRHPQPSSTHQGVLAHQISLAPTRSPLVPPRKNLAEQPAVVLSRSSLPVPPGRELLPLSRQSLHPSGQRGIHLLLLCASSASLAVQDGASRKGEERLDK